VCDVDNERGSWHPSRPRKQQHKAPRHQRSAPDAADKSLGRSIATPDIGTRRPRSSLLRGQNVYVENRKPLIHTRAKRGWPRKKNGPAGSKGTMHVEVAVGDEAIMRLETGRGVNCWRGRGYNTIVRLWHKGKKPAPVQEWLDYFLWAGSRARTALPGTISFIKMAIGLGIGVTGETRKNTSAFS